MIELFHDGQLIAKLDPSLTMRLSCLSKHQVAMLVAEAAGDEFNLAGLETAVMQEEVNSVRSRFDRVEINVVSLDGSQPSPSTLQVLMPRVTFKPDSGNNITVYLDAAKTAAVFRDGFKNWH